MVYREMNDDPIYGLSAARNQGEQLEKLYINQDLSRNTRLGTNWTFSDMISVFSGVQSQNVLKTVLKNS